MNQEKIGHFIAKCRKEKHLTQSKLAEKLGVTDKSVSNWENGKNLPDISLFNLLCEELGISINDLLSGEKVSEKDYKNKLETNLVNMIANVKKRNMRRLQYLIIAIIIAYFLFILGIILYNTIELDVGYDSRTMKCSISNNKLTYEIYGTSVLNTNYLERNIEGKTYLIFHSTINLYNKRNSNFEYGYSFAQANDGKKVPFGYTLILDHFKADDQIYVYYSDDNLARVNKLSNSEFLKRIKKYPEICSND